MDSIEKFGQRSKGRYSIHQELGGGGRGGEDRRQFADPETGRSKGT